MKQHFGLDGSSADFTIDQGRVVPDYKISFVIIVKKGVFQDLLTFNNRVALLQLREPSVDFFS